MNKMSENEAVGILKIELENTKRANECGLATKGEFDKQIQAIEIILQGLEKKDKIIDAMLEEITDCEFEMQCSNCTYECEKDYDQLYKCNKQYFERKVKDE